MACVHWSLVTCLFAVTVNATPSVREGLCLWLAADAGVVSAGDTVQSWADQSGSGLIAVPPAERQGPWQGTVEAGLAFGHERFLQICGAIAPSDTHGLTVIAVARPEAPSSVTIFGSRDGNVPLVQLDVEGAGMARFIVRDKQSRTLQSLSPALLGHRSIYVGTFSTAEDDTTTVTVSVGDAKGKSASGPLQFPLLSSVSWIGGLQVGKHEYDFDGSIDEILVYNRALSSAELGVLRDEMTKKYDIKPPEPPEARGPDSFDVLHPEREWASPSSEMVTDVCVVGVGSGGIGATLAAARRGARVVAVERQALIGGTGVNAFVSSWEPGPGCSLAEEIYEHMRRTPGAAGVAIPQRKVSTFPMGFYLVDENAPYSQSLRRIRTDGKKKANVQYKPAAMDRTARELFAETGNVTLLDNTTFFKAEVERKRVTSILVSNAAGKTIRIRAKVFIDCTGDVYVCRSAGCEVMLGVDAKSRFGESMAPEEAQLQLNAISRCYTIRPSANPKRAEEPSSRVKRFPRCAWITGWRDGVRTVNPLPMLQGRALIDHGYDECMARTEKMVQAHWHWLQAHAECDGYEFDRIAPMLGIREGYRLVAEYVLRQDDISDGLPKQTHPDIIAVADHPCDVHGAGSVHLKMATGYGIPYRCLIPKGGWENLLAACRGAGFSRIAASSCRLERTMIQLGHAAGVGAAMAVKNDCSVSAIDVPALVEELDARSRYDATR